jgi:hypothetical protein
VTIRENIFCKVDGSEEKGAGARGGGFWEVTTASEGSSRRGEEGEGNGYASG